VPSHHDYTDFEAQLEILVCLFVILWGLNQRWLPADNLCSFFNYRSLKILGPRSLKQKNLKKSCQLFICRYNGVSHTCLIKTPASTSHLADSMSSVHRQHQTTESVFSIVQFRKVNSVL
jgi:hypothetical protein